MATGGMLTSLDGATGIGQGASDAHEETWRMIVRRDAGIIATALNRTVTDALLDRAFPGRPHLAAFDFETEPAPAPAEVFDLAAKAVLMQVADGALDASAARLALTDTLAQLGYAPEPGTEGTLKDARTLARLNLVLKTNRQTAASLAQLAESEDPQVAALFPAWELASGGYRKHHRTDWPQRWNAAGERVAWRGAHRTKMVALKSSPIWQALGDGAGGFRDTLGNPYPPFAFGSSYEWVPVDRLEAKELGLLGEENGERKTANRSPLTAHRSPRSAVRRAAALLISVLAGRAIRNKARHCPQDGAFLDKDGDCHNPRHGGTKGKSVTEGYKGRCSQAEAEALLRQKVALRDEAGEKVVFDDFALTHYLHGQRRQGNVPKPDNLRWLPAAIHAVKHGNRTMKFPKHSVWDHLNPPKGTQYEYTENLGGKRTMHVFVYMDTGRVSGWHVS